MHLEVAAVDAVVVLDHELRELDVPVLEDLGHAVERLDHHVERPERLVLEPLELLPEVAARLGRHQPNFPVTYSSVRVSDGVVKIFSVSSNSTSSPVSMKAVLSATRAACCMLWVTITIV